MRFAAERQIKLESSVRPSVRRRTIGLPMLGFETWLDAVGAIAIGDLGR